MLDGWVARVANFEPLRRDYWMLTALPARFDEHAQRMRLQSDEDLAAVRALEQAAAEAAGVPQREDALADAAEALAAVDEKIDEHEAALDALVEKRAAFAAGDDDLSRRCNEIVRDALRGETMRRLRERATATPTPDDDAAVDQLTVVRADLPRVEEEAKRFRELHETNRDRAAKLEEIRKRFKESRYDAVSSEFVNGALIATLLTQLLAGALGVGDIWDALKKQQRYRNLGADPRFGSGKFPRGGNPWGGGWGGGGGFGGGFGKRGGGFGGGGFKTGGGFGRGGGFADRRRFLGDGPRALAQRVEHAVEGVVGAPQHDGRRLDRALRLEHSHEGFDELRGPPRSAGAVAISCAASCSRRELVSMPSSAVD